MRHPVSLLLALLLLALAAPGAHAIRVGALVEAVPKNPVEDLVRLAPDPEVYDRATHCSRSPTPGMTAFVDWLGRNSIGTS